MTNRIKTMNESIYYNVDEIHLLSYHKLGYDKYVGLSRDYLMGDTPLIEKEKFDLLVENAKKSGLTVKVGG